MFYSGADRFHYAGHLVTEDSSIWRFAGIERERFKDVAEIHSRRLHFDQHFACAAGRWSERRETQSVEMPTLAGHKSQRHFGIE